MVNKNKISVRIKATMSDILYDKFLTNIEDNGFILMEYHDGLWNIMMV